MRRVAIVDDDPWVREGRAAALARAGTVEIAYVGGHAEALARPSWGDVDVVLLDAHDPAASFDRFVGVAVVERIRATRTSEQTWVAILTGHAANDLLRIRMAEAGADVLHSHADIRTVDDLLSVVDRTASAVPPADGEARERAGIGRTARVNEAVSWAGAHLGDEALAGDAPQKTLGISRRQLITARERIADLGGLTPERRTARERRLPEWREVTRFLQRARGAERRTR